MSNEAVEHHLKAAEHHEHAAQHHKEAATHLKAARHEMAVQHTRLANGDLNAALFHAAEAEAIQERKASSAHA
jgi:hypothetical protein